MKEKKKASVKNYNAVNNNTKKNYSAPSVIAR
jgi:hypothetical protein